MHEGSNANEFTGELFVSHHKVYVGDGIYVSRTQAYTLTTIFIVAFELAADFFIWPVIPASPHEALMDSFVAGLAAGLAVYLGKKTLKIVKMRRFQRLSRGRSNC